MFRKIFAILLLANLLACPVRCISCNAGAAERENCAPAACSCCHRDVTPAQTDAPKGSRPTESPDEECTCPDCICEGATLQPDCELPATCQHTVMDGTWSADASLGTGETGTELGPQDGCSCQPCGRAARIAQRSWLI